MKKRTIKQCFGPLALLSMDSVTVRAINGVERDNVGKWQDERRAIVTADPESKDPESIKKLVEIHHRFVGLYLGDETGARVFGEDELNEVAQLPIIDQRKISDEGSKFNFGNPDDTKKN